LEVLKVVLCIFKGGIFFRVRAGAIARGFRSFFSERLSLIGEGEVEVPIEEVWG
jgi:hypothetical protein